MNTQNNENKELFVTRNRPLENFLYLHEIRAVKITKDDDGFTAWHYIDDEELRDVVEEYKRVQKKRRARIEREHAEHTSSVLRF